MTHKFSPERMARLESPERHRNFPPEELLRRFGVGLREGEVLLDVGCGPGFFALPAARLIGPSGRVIGIDTAPEMVEAANGRAREAGVANLEVLRSEENTFPVADSAVDLLWIAFLAHELLEPVAFFRECRRVLRPGGRLAVIDWRKDPEAAEMGPALDERVGEEDVAEALVSAGLALSERGRWNRFTFYITAVRPAPDPGEA